MLRLVPLALALSASAAIAQGTAIPTPTHDWGCEVLLCLANPNGPTAVAPCVPPIQRLWRELARGHAFPSCSMATGPGGRSYAQPVSSYYDRCPNGMSELAPGQVAELAGPMRPTSAPTTRSGTSTTYTAASTGFTYTGIGHGDGYGQPSADSSPPVKVCVAGHRGTRHVSSGDTGYTVELYETIVVSPAQASPHLIEVYVDNALWHSVRW
jgi:hypothetical protein